MPSLLFYKNYGRRTMRVCGMIDVERRLIDLYNVSLCNSNPKEQCKAQKTIRLIESCFVLIGIFTGEDHCKMINCLYFSKRNILNVEKRNMAEKIFVSERTMFSYRKKYCKVFNYILKFIEDNNLCD